MRLGEDMAEPRLRTAQSKAAVLTEALPYIRKWAGATVVIKAGGEVLEDEEVKESLISDVVLMSFVGMNPVLVHGGGPQITREMKARGWEPAFVDGRRVTDAGTMEIVRRVLTGLNEEVAAALERHGGKARAISAERSDLIRARPAPGPAGEDLGLVGEVEAVDAQALRACLDEGCIPVVAPVGPGPAGMYNINADVAAAALASALGAQKIVFLTNVAGLYGDLRDSGSLISEIRAGVLEEMLAGGGVSAGMIPKIQSALEAMRRGVPQAHLLDGRVRHALLLEIFTDEGAGTMVLP